MRIECLWRDVHQSVVVVYGNRFREMETEGVLDHLNEVDIYCLHFVFIPRINDSLKIFMEGWNNHAMSTERDQTPYQMLVSGLIPQLQEIDEVESESDSGSDSERLQQACHEPVSVPRCSFTPCDVLAHELDGVNPLSLSDQHGRSHYSLAVRIVGDHLNNGCDDCIVHN